MRSIPTSTRIFLRKIEGKIDYKKVSERFRKIFTEKNKMEFCHQGYHGKNMVRIWVGNNVLPREYKMKNPG